MCYLGLSDYERSAKEFVSVIEKNPGFRKNIYLLASIAFKKLNNIPSAIRMVESFNEYTLRIVRKHPVSI